jgi:hypothetical protein
MANNLSFADTHPTSAQKLRKSKLTPAPPSGAFKHTQACDTLPISNNKAEAEAYRTEPTRAGI